jgi:hypothetical protein
MPPLKCNVKVKLSQGLIISALFHEYILRSGGIAPPYSASALDGGE